MSGSPGRPARGRRDNGLDARAFVAVGDLDPRVGEHLLDVLAVAHIAAYLQPSSELDPVSRSTILPSTPTDRLWVDSEHAAHARALVARVHGEESPVSPAGTPAQRSAEQPSDQQSDQSSEQSGGTRPVGAAADTGAELDVDAAWRSIVAGYDSPAHGDGTWPASEGGPPAGRHPNGPRPGLTRADHLRPIGAGPRDHSLAEPGEGDLDDMLDEDPDAGYEPPPPPPLPRPSQPTVLGVLAVLLGFALFFGPGLLPLDPQAVMVLGALGILGGAGLLVLQLRETPSSDNDPDDGAVV